MRPRHFWIGIALLVFALIAHAAIPRYEFRHVPESRYWVRTDRWTGSAVIGQFGPSGDWFAGQWNMSGMIMVRRDIPLWIVGASAVAVTGGLIFVAWRRRVSR